MAKGIAFPFSASYGKGIELDGGTSYIESLVLVALGRCPSDNPFQDLGIGDEIIFANLNDGFARGWAERKIRGIFKSFRRQELAELVDLKFEDGVQDPTRPSQGQEAELTAVITYIDLEHDSEQELKVGFPLGS